LLEIMVAGSTPIAPSQTFGRNPNDHGGGVFNFLKRLRRSLLDTASTCDYQIKYQRPELAMKVLESDLFGSHPPPCAPSGRVRWDFASEWTISL